jgi:hypothetical protein
MIAPQSQGYAAGFPSGTRSAKIIIRCLHEGRCLIDGQFTGRRQISFSFNTDIEVLGLNVCCSGPGVGPILISNAKRISIRRVIGWDQHRVTDSGSSAAHNSFASVERDTEDILFEDCAGFGLGQRVARAGFGGSGGSTWRRCWFRFEGHQGTEPSSIFNVLRNSAGPLIENSIFIYDGSRGDATAQRGVMQTGGQRSGTTARMLGNIVYGNANSQSGVAAQVFNDRLTSAVVDHLAVDARNSDGSPATFTCLEGCSSNIARNITMIRRSGAPAPTFSAEWTGNNRNHGTSLGTVPNIFTGTNGANICKRYVDGVLTTTPLWPWAMDQRIKEAIDTARASQTIREDPKSPPLSGNTVTAEIESRFGAIPSECRSR